MSKNYFVLFILIVCINYNIKAQKCGVPKIGRGNIIGGEFVIHGQFPWFAAIMKVNPNGEQRFHGGGTLISNKFVITAAHCILNKGQNQPLLPRELLVVLGSYNLDLKFEIGRESKFPLKIHIHPDWNPHIVSFDADIAIMEFEFPFTFNNYIQPICLEKFSFDKTSGIVVGYGKSEDETKRHENIPKVIDVPIKSQEDCFLSNAALVSLASNRTLCGGHRNETGVCLGDSGGGLVIQSKNIFYLVGIVSSSLIRNFSCDVNNYAIFTNILKFFDWIKKFLPEESFEENFECGIMSSPSGLIQNGKFASLSEFSWMATIAIKGISYMSSGALISDKHVLSKGTFIGGWTHNHTKVTPNDISRFKIYLGSLSRVDDKNVYNAQKIIIHPDIKEVVHTPTNNIGIIVLSTSIEFSNSIRTVCLWTFSDDLYLIKNLPIYAVGYRHDENEIVTNVRKYAKVTLIDQNECKQKYSRYEKLLNEDKSFCAIGDANGSPCFEDECLFVKFNGKWFLRGIMLRFQAYINRTCKIGNESPFLYHDISSNINWIQSVINEE